MTSTETIQLAATLPLQLVAMLMLGLGLVALNRPKDPPSYA